MTMNSDSVGAWTAAGKDEILYLRVHRVPTIGIATSTVCFSCYGLLSKRLRYRGEWYCVRCFLFVIGFVYEKNGCNSG